jgi:hypothetical protein
MLCRQLSLWIALVSLFPGLTVESQPVPLETLPNAAIFFPAAGLTTNGVPGLTNLAPHLMVSAVDATSTQGGSLTLVNTQAWVNRFDGPEHYPDAGSGVAIDSSGNLLAVGGSYSVASAYDVITIKYSAAGMPLWTNRYNGSANSDDFGWRVGTDAADNVYVACSSVGAGTGNDIVLIKCSSAGSALWTNCYNSASTNNDYPTAFTVDPAGNSYLLIMTYDATPAAYVTVRCDASGRGLWTKVYHGPAGGTGLSAGAGGRWRGQRVCHRQFAGSRYDRRFHRHHKIFRGRHAALDQPV